MGTLSQSLFIPLIGRLIAFHRGIECYLGFATHRVMC